MSRPRRKMFGPLFYTTVVVAILVTAWVWVDASMPMVQQWLWERSLIRSLRADDAREREEAATTLVLLGFSSAVPQLTEAARDPRPDIRSLACRYLIEAGTKRDVVVPILVTAASDVEEKVRFEAACAFGRLIHPGVQGRAQLIVSTHGKMSPSLRAESIRALRRLMHDQASLTRIAAADALGLFGPDPEAASDLSAATGDNDRDVRFAAARALLKVSGANDRSAGRTLAALVTDPEPIADRRAILDVVLSAGAEVQDQAVAALARLVADVDTASSSTCPPKCRPRLPRNESAMSRGDGLSGKVVRHCIFDSMSQKHELPGRSSPATFAD